MKFLIKITVRIIKLVETAVTKALPKKTTIRNIAQQNLTEEQERLEQITLEDYQRAVTFLAEDKSDFLFPNSGPNHAAIVISTIIKFSKKEVRIYDDALDGDLDAFGGVISSSLLKSIEEGKTIKIVVRNNACICADSYRSLVSYAQKLPNQVMIRKCNDNFKSAVKAIFEEDINFAVGDNTSFRIEMPDKESTNKRKAVCCFNRRSYARSLVKTFDKHFRYLETAY